MSRSVPRVGVVALLHESNTFLEEPTTIGHFQRDLLATGEDVRTALAAAHHEVGGFFEGLAAAGLEAVPVFAARALPSGPIERGAFRQLLDRLGRALAAAGRLDGILAAPHGATVAEGAADADGHWLTLVRDHLGGRPLIATIDPHANLSPAMVAATDALIAYRTNPHVDQRARGLEAARLMALTLAGRIRPTQAAAFPPLSIPIACQDPATHPCLPHYEAMAALREAFERQPDPASVPCGTVLSTSVVLGFPYADVREMGSSVVVVTHDDPEAARRHALEAGDRLWDARDTFLPRLLGVTEAIDDVLDGGLGGEAAGGARGTGPVCLLDMGDNVGGGSPADGTVLPRALHHRGVAGSFACLCDPRAAAAAHAAGIDARLTLAVGGHSPAWRGVADAAPLESTWTVTHLSNGRFREPQPRHGGLAEFDQGRTAVLRTDCGLSLMVTTHRMAPFSLEQVRHVGLDPGRFRILVAKGVHAPRAAYAEVCGEFVRVDTPGVTTADATRLAFEHRRRPLFPFELEALTLPSHCSI
jgi:microcystin degradation protein MlrC